ncbi:MAG TPA: hypothetical protein VF503_20565 [Sphingobium sp.]|uniref:hypothetical protein n=1 Tax=Sphingobium sp. TaxID=1912891 RepID=UPI002ED24661
MSPPRISDHGSEIGLLAFIAFGVFVAMCVGIWRGSAAHPFDPSAYLVVLTLIVGAIKERWTQRSVDRMGQSLANSPPADPPAQEPKT